MVLCKPIVPHDGLVLCETGKVFIKKIKKTSGQIVNIDGYFRRKHANQRVTAAHCLSGIGAGLPFAGLIWAFLSNKEYVCLCNNRHLVRTLLSRAHYLDTIDPSQLRLHQDSKCIQFANVIWKSQGSGNRVTGKAGLRSASLSSQITFLCFPHGRSVHLVSTEHLKPDFNGTNNFRMTPLPPLICPLGSAL